MHEFHYGVNKDILKLAQRQGGDVGRLHSMTGRHTVLNSTVFYRKFFKTSEGFESVESIK